VAVAAVYFSLTARRGSGSFQKKKILKTREFTHNFHFEERYTIELDEFHRLEAIALVYISHRVKNPEIFKVTVAIHLFSLPSRCGSGRCSAAMDIYGP
jgi:hypothetical protein